MDWFRWWHGTVTDPKFQWVARRSGQPLAAVIAVWAALLECASTATQCNADATRGNVASFDCNDWDVALNLEDGSVSKIFGAMEQKTLIEEKRIVAWEARQPKREDAGNPNTGALSSTERSRVFRENKKRSATTSNEVQRNATVGNDRLDKSREEKKEVKHMSGKPDVAEVLRYLNEKAGRNFQPVPANVKFVEARIKEGATVEQIKQVIDAKVRDWLNDPKMSEFLRPETLFNATKYAQYVGQLGTKAVNGNGQSHDARYVN